MDAACKTIIEQHLVALGLQTNVPVPSEVTIFKSACVVTAEFMEEDPAVVGKSIADTFCNGIRNIPGAPLSFALDTSITCDAAGKSRLTITIDVYVNQRTWSDSIFSC